MTKIISISFLVLVFGTFFVMNTDGTMIWLKDQIKSSNDSDDYVCWNHEQLLVERPNGKYACVYPYTAVKLNWEILSKYTFTPIETRNGNFTIFNHFSQGSLTNMTVSEDNYSLLITFSTDESGKLSIKIPVTLIGSTNENCFPKSSYPNYYPFIIFSTEEEISFTERISTETARYLEISYDKDSTDLEIIGSCLT